MRVKIKFCRTKHAFQYGNCAAIAICQAFDLTTNSFRVIAGILNLKWYDGLTFWECSKVINTLSKHTGIRAEYVSNSTKVTYEQLLSVLSKNTIIAMFDKHLSYAKYGKVFDDFFHGNKRDENLILTTPPTGYWVIGNHYR